MPDQAEHIQAADFKARCLKLMDRVEQDRVEVVITKRGRPVAKLVPVSTYAPEPFGSMRGTITIHGDIVAPIDVAWEAAGDTGDS